MIEVYKVSQTDLNKIEYYIENFISIIWTERFSQYGDFEIVLEYTSRNLENLTVGSLLRSRGWNSRASATDLNATMIIDTISIDIDDEGDKKFKIIGRSIESLLENRVINGPTGGGLTSFNGQDGGEVMPWPVYFVKHVCVDGLGTSSLDIIPFMGYSPSEPFTNVYVNNLGNISYNAGSIYQYLTRQNVGYKNASSFGFTSYVHTGYTGDYWNTNGRADFYVYRGSLLNLVFSEETGTIQSTSYLSSVKNYYNVAFVSGKFGSVLVDAFGTLNPTVSGNDRKVLFVDALSTTTAAGTALNNELAKIGKEALSDKASTKITEVNLSSDGYYKFGKDYDLGDVVYLDSVYGISRAMITEYVYSIGPDGIKEYPTFESYIV